MAYSSKSCQGTGFLATKPTTRQTKDELFANFKIGDHNSPIWDDDELWETEEDIDASNEELYQESNRISSLRPPVQGDGEEWYQIELSEIHENDCDLDGDEYYTSSESSDDEEFHPHSNIPTPESLSDFDQSKDESEQDYGVWYAQRVLAVRAVSPARREQLYPKRKNIIIQCAPSGMREEAVVKQCTNCDKPAHRHLEDLCCSCAMDLAQAKIDELEAEKQLLEDDWRIALEEMDVLEADIKAADPKFAENEEWLDLHSAKVDAEEQYGEQQVQLQIRVAELRREIKQYKQWRGCSE